MRGRGPGQGPRVCCGLGGGLDLTVIINNTVRLYTCTCKY